MKALLKIIVITGIICSAQLLKAQPDELSQTEMSEIRAMLKENSDKGWKDFEKHIQNGEYVYAFKRDWSEKLNILSTKIAKEKVVKERRKLLFEYLQLVTLSAEKFDINLVKKALKEIPPNWKPWGIEKAPDVTRLIYKIKPSEFFENYAQKVGENIHDELPKVLYNIGLQADIHNDSLKVVKIIERLEKEFPESGYPDVAKISFRLSPFKKIKAGRTVPEFSIKNPAKPDEFITDKSLHGKFYLLYFQGLCYGEHDEAEMPFLQSAFKKYSADNFDIVNIYYGKDKRAEKWGKPWSVCKLTMDESKIAGSFEIQIWPDAVLVSPDGVILATGLELRGKALEKTLARFIKN